MTDAPITPAEAFVLLDPLEASPAEAFKIAFLSLVALGVLRITMVETRTAWLRKQTVPMVSVIRDPPAIPVAAETVSVVRQARASKGGVDLAAVARSAVKTFGPGLMKLRSRVIQPALAERGLLLPQPYRVLWVLSRTRYLHTPAGLAEQRRIEALLDRARLLPSLMETDRDAAKAIVLAAGSLLLLVPELKGIYGQLARLDAALAPDTGGVDFSDFGDGFSGPSHHHADAFHFGAFDTSALDLDFGSFDSSFDSSISDSGGDGGSDGGGGHH
jgi:uncharacterized membrane protein YgcG